MRDDYPLAKPSPWRGKLLLAATVLGVGLTGWLGSWQLGRATQKVALQSAIDTRGGLAPLPQAELAQSSQALADQLYRRVALRGHWLADRTIYLENRQMNGRPGFVVVTPLQWPGGAVLVQRGWVARDNDSRTRLPALVTPTSEVELTGRIAPPPARLYEFSAAASGAIRQNLDPESYSREIGVALLPLSVTQDEGGSGDGLQRHWPRPALDIQKHYGYTFQWWSLSALMAGLYVWFQIIRPRRVAR